MTNGPAISIYGEHDEDDRPPPIPPRPPDTLPSYHQDMLNRSPTPPSSSSPSPPPPPPPSSLPPGPPVVHTHSTSEDEYEPKRAHIDEKEEENEDDDVEEVLVRYRASTEESLTYENDEPPQIIKGKEIEEVQQVVNTDVQGEGGPARENEIPDDSFLLQGGGEKGDDSPLFPPPLPPKMSRRSQGIDTRPRMPLPSELRAQDMKMSEQSLLNELTELEEFVSKPQPAPLQPTPQDVLVSSVPVVEKNIVRSGGESSTVGDENIQ